MESRRHSHLLKYPVGTASELSAVGMGFSAEGTRATLLSADGGFFASIVSERVQ